MEEKHAVLSARMQANQDARRAQRDNRKKEAEELKDPKESALEFYSVFSLDKQRIADRISRLQSCPPDGINAELEAVSEQVKQLQQSLAAATFFLPSYDVRQSQEAISKLEADIQSVQASLVPKKKFAFSRKQKPAADVAPADQASNTPDTATAPSVPVPVPADAPAAAVPSASIPSAASQQEGDITIQNLKGEVVRKSGAIPNVFIQNLEDCVVYLCGNMMAVRIDKLRRCKIFAGPVAGSIHLDDAQDCQFHLASRQIRIHTSQRCDYFLHVRSTPIIEHSTGLRFAPYDFSYPNIEQDMTTAELDSSINCWADVKDFNWLRQQQSPNWSIIPEEERTLHRLEQAGIDAGVPSEASSETKADSS
eukprot:GILK01007089.1.p1 GENE.GILK01007089.1~~GILK01007089.1.p1  ORF type:complete len:385 (-),score=61.92 GILK01007089.1:53-1150(-)